MKRTAELLRASFSYCADSGKFTRLTSTSRGAAGTEPGGIDKIHGYRRIYWQGKLWKAHWLAWLWMTGEWPENQIDHRNGVRDDNRWSNLRPASNSENCQNLGLSSCGVSSLRGAAPTATGRWRAYIRPAGGKYTHIGVFDTAQDAHDAYVKEKRRLHHFWAEERASAALSHAEPAISSRSANSASS